MNNNKYKLSTITVSAISLFFICFFKFASPSSSTIVGVTLVVAWLIMFIIYIIVLINNRKKNKSAELNKEHKSILIQAICILFIGLLCVMAKIYSNNKFIKDIFISSSPIGLIIFGKISSDYQISKSKDKKEIERTKRKTTLLIAMLSIVEIVVLYGVFVLKK
jgi:amino acid transporter